MAIKNLRLETVITDRDAQSVQKYLNDIAKLDMISLEEEVALAKKIKKGDHDALEKLVNANLRFVVSTAKQYQHSGLALNDLINEGNIGLIIAAQRFDYTRGFKFISYAVWWIRQSIMEALSENSRVVRIPINRITDHGQMEKSRTLNAYCAEYEIDDFSNIPVDVVMECMSVSRDSAEVLATVTDRHVSLDATFDVWDGAVSRADVLPDPDRCHVEQMIQQDSLKEEVRKILGGIPKKHANLVTYCFGLDGSYPLQVKDAAKKAKLSREGARQIRNKSLKKWRGFEFSSLREYLNK